MSNQENQVIEEVITDKEKKAEQIVGEKETADIVAEEKATAKDAELAKKLAAKAEKEEVEKVALEEARAKERAKKEAAGRAAAKAEEKSAPKKEASAPATSKTIEIPKTIEARHRLKTRFNKEIIPILMKEKGYKNVNEVPKIHKIVLNMRLGDIKDNSKSIQLAQKELDQIAGQKTVIVKAKKSVANFKLRENQPIGIKVTLRGNKMYEFFDRLVAIALPRVRDFRGVSPKSFDGRGNYAMGIKEQITFPEISYETVEKVRGFDIAIVTTAKTDDEAKALLTKLGMPYKAN